MIFMNFNDSAVPDVYLLVSGIKHRIPEDPRSFMRVDEIYDYWRYRARSLGLPFHASRLVHKLAILSWKRTKKPRGT